MRHIEVLVEERSAEELLRIVLPRLLGGITFSIYPYSGKHDLLGKLPDRLRGYRSWLPEDHRIVVLVDRDDEDCRVLKNRLEQTARQAGLGTRTSSSDDSCQLINRLAIEELEAWYFGDWNAVRAAFPRVPDTVPRKTAYRDPDSIRGGTCESFERILRNAGYFKGGLRKIETARRIAEHLDPDRNTSRSFQVFRDGVRELVRAPR